jgi:mannosyltransferase OCH1-like enzyme
MIPHFLHQYWDTGDPPASVRPLLATWSELNRGWNYRLWNDESIIDFIEAQHFGASVRGAYEACRFPAMRADLARYILLWKLGGVYADADLTCLRPLHEVVDTEASLVIFRGWNGAWRNDFMAAAPGCLVLEEFISKAVSNISARFSPHNLWLVTGPGMTTPIVQNVLANDSIRIQTFEFNEVKGKILTFNQDLDYRQGDKHWSLAQRTEGIYRA